MSADIPVVLLVGGRAVRLGGENHPVAKPLIRVAGAPLLWHVLSCYIQAGHRSFVLPLGHMAAEIAAYVEELAAALPDCVFRCVETPPEAGTGTRIAAVLEGLDCETVAVTYGDGVADLDLRALLRFHRTHGAPATLTGVHPRSDYGELAVAPDGTLEAFEEKPRLVQRFVNGGFMLFDRSVWGRFDAARDEMLELGPLRRMVEHREICMYPHRGAWCAVDTWKDVARLEEMLRIEAAPRSRLVRGAP